MSLQAITSNVSVLWGLPLLSLETEQSSCALHMCVVVVDRLNMWSLQTCRLAEPAKHLVSKWISVG